MWVVSCTRNFAACWRFPLRITKALAFCNTKWERDPHYKVWVSALKADKWKAWFQCCDRIIDVSKMGYSALKSHSKMRSTSKKPIWIADDTIIFSDKIQELTDLDASVNPKLEKFSEVSDLIPCTTLMTVSCLYCTFLCRTSHTKSLLNWGVNYRYAKLSD